MKNVCFYVFSLIDVLIKEDLWPNFSQKGLPLKGLFIKKTTAMEAIVYTNRISKDRTSNYINNLSGVNQFSLYLTGIVLCKNPIFPILFCILSLRSYSPC